MFDKVKRKDYTHSSKGDAPSAMYQKTLSYYITMLYRSFAGFTGDKLQEVGLNFGLLFFIVYIGKRPNCTPSELTKELSLDWGHSQRCINRLVDDGLITKEKKRSSLHVESDRTRATSIYYRSPGILRLGCCLYDRTNPKGKGTVAGFTGKSSRKDSSSCTKRSIVQSIMAGLN